jgi:hypothetical protein
MLELNDLHLFNQPCVRFRASIKARYGKRIFGLWRRLSNVSSIVSLRHRVNLMPIHGTRKGLCEDGLLNERHTIDFLEPHGRRGVAEVLPQAILELLDETMQSHSSGC